MTGVISALCFSCVTMARLMDFSALSGIRIVSRCVCSSGVLVFVYGLVFGP